MAAVDEETIPAVAETPVRWTDNDFAVVGPEMHEDPWPQPPRVSSSKEWIFGLGEIGSLALHLWPKGEYAPLRR